MGQDGKGCDCYGYHTQQRKSTTWPFPSSRSLSVQSSQRYTFSFAFSFSAHSGVKSRSGVAQLPPEVMVSTSRCIVRALDSQVITGR